MTTRSAADCSHSSKAVPRPALPGALPATAVRERGATAHSTLPAQPSSIPVSAAPRPQLTAVRETLQSSGQPLDAATRASLEPRFGRDFRDVRVHADESANESAHAVDALAYTAGNHIVFNRGRYAPESVSGRRLLIHELAHVAQQGSRPAAPESDWRLGSASSATELAADAALAAVEQMPQIHSGMLGSQLAAMAPAAPILHRAVATWGGEWSTTKYEPLPAHNGMDINLKFKPGDPVDASMISIVQKVTSKVNNTVAFPDNTVKDRSIPPGSPGEGASIDRISKAKNPLYATDADAPASHLWDSPPDKFWGEAGFHHVDGKGVVNHKDATLNDKPSIIPMQPNSSQIFEDTALAVTGVQTGAAYGSVQWGYKTDAANNLTKLPLTKVSDDAPSGTFRQAQSLWNKNKDAAGDDLLKFYAGTGKFIQSDDTPLVADPADAAKTAITKLSKDTRVEMINIGAWEKFNLPDPKAKDPKAPKAAQKPQWHKITVTEGAEKGKTGWVLASQLGNTKVKAPAAVK